MQIQNVVVRLKKDQNLKQKCCFNMLHNGLAKARFNVL